MQPYSTTTEVIDAGPGKWKTARINIFAGVGDSAKQIGSYERNHAGWCDSTFSPFTRDGRWYALYSPRYTATRIMELPSCKDIGGEEPNENGFCPVDYYVPHDHPAVVQAGAGGHFGFVAGCIWGDDSSWKIQFLDLSEAPRGVLVRKEAFGYLSIYASEGISTRRLHLPRRVLPRISASGAHGKYARQPYRRIESVFIRMKSSDT